MGADAALEEVRKWIGSSPRPQLFNRGQRPSGGSHDSRAEQRDTMPDEDRPDVAMAQMVVAEVEKSGGKLGYLGAQRVVMRRNPELANAYRIQPGNKE